MNDDISVVNDTLHMSAYTCVDEIPQDDEPSWFRRMWGVDGDDWWVHVTAEQDYKYYAHAMSRKSGYQFIDTDGCDSYEQAVRECELVMPVMAHDVIRLLHAVDEAQIAFDEGEWRCD